MLEEVIVSSPIEWTAEPDAVIESLRHPTYIAHYFRGVTKVAKQVAGSGSRPRSSRDECGNPPLRDVEPIGNDDFEYDPDWTGADSAAIDMLGALANNDAAFGESIAKAWELTTSALRARPESADPAIESRRSDSDEADPLASAIDRPYSRALETTIALGWWETTEHRQPQRNLHGVARRSHRDSWLGWACGTAQSSPNADRPSKRSHTTGLRSIREQAVRCFRP